MCDSHSYDMPDIVKRMPFIAQGVAEVPDFVDNGNHWSRDLSRAESSLL